VDDVSAYRHCEQITRAQARNFFYGIRLLPGPKRRALSAIYALARRVDDIGDDETLSAQARVARLDQLRKQLPRIDDERNDPVLVAVAATARRYPIPFSAFEDLIDGCQADARGTTYGTFEELVHYCRCVAGSVGRLSLGVFGTPDPAAASPIADDLGVALQLTNILRDVMEDRSNGRVYLPAEDLARFGVHPDDLAADPQAFARLIRFEVDRSLEWYGRGFTLLPMLDRRSAACTAAMAGIYRRLLDRIAADPLAVLHRRVSLRNHEKAVVAVRSLLRTAA
jgi:15-cis-phytoene synthase